MSPNYTYSFQEQEKQQDTGWSSFKWRNYDPTYVRFFNVDPLAEKYAYQSPFNFSENAVVAHRELEGLEKQHVFYTPFGVLVYTSSAGGHYTGTGVYNELKGYTQNSLRFWGGVAEKGVNLLAVGGTLGIGLATNVLKSESKAENKGSDSKSTEEGVIYKRKDKNGKEKDYVGQAKNKARYEKRQKEHGKANPDADYEFEEIDRGKPGKDLNEKEQKHINEGGGPTNKSNPNGGLQNKRNQIKQPKQPKPEEPKKNG